MEAKKMNKLMKYVTLTPVEGSSFRKDDNTSLSLNEAIRDPGNELETLRVQTRSSKAKKTVLLVDERQLTLECFASWLEARITDMSIATCASANEVVQRAHLNAATVALVLLNIGSRLLSDPKSADELSMLQDLLPNVPVVIISDHQGMQQIVDALQLGVRGYIPTSTAMAVVVGAIRLVQSGGVFVPASSLTALGREQVLRTSMFDMTEDSAFEDFTNRQKQVLACLHEGKPNKLIAHELDMCESTVKVHVRHIMKKLGATNRTQVAYLTKGLFSSK
jgi:DNA-binding NarL/FixJ family response regulator